MNGRSLGVLLIAVVLGLGAMFLTSRFMSKPVVAEETQDVVVAARDFKEEEILKPDMLKLERMPTKVVPPGSFAALKDVEDRWVKNPMLEGEPIIERKLGPKGTPPGLVSVIPKGMRAFAVEVNEQSGVSGFILPGHHVDVVRYETGDNNRRHPGETILQDILVLASGQTFTRSDEKSLPTHTVTLAVTPEQVGVLVAAKAKGALNLSLRGVNDHEVVAQPKPQPPQNDEEKARRIKLEKELADVKLAQAKSTEGMAKLEKALKEAQSALARKMAEPPPPPPAPKSVEPRGVRIYRPLLGKKNGENPELVGYSEADRVEIARRARSGRTEGGAEPRFTLTPDTPASGGNVRETDEDRAEPRGFGFGGPAITEAVSRTRGDTTRTP
ncbi:MAG: Flp pilus assembly protein CpaB [Isosphaeraceae bacterium]